MNDTSSKTETAASGVPVDAQGSVNAQGNESQANTDSKSKPAFVVHRQYVKDLSFESPNAVHALMPNAKQRSVSIKVDINGLKLNPEDRLYEVAIAFRIKAVSEGEKDEEELLCFILDLTYCTLLTVSDEVPKEHQDFAAMVEGGALGFPFARAIIASTIQEGGFPALYLSPINFPELVQNKARQITEQQKQSDAKLSADAE